MPRLGTFLAGHFHHRLLGIVGCHEWLELGEVVIHRAGLRDAFVQCVPWVKSGSFELAKMPYQE